jgi:hypothetical protein
VFRRKSFLIGILLLQVICSNVAWAESNDENFILGLKYPASYDLTNFPTKMADSRPIGYNVHLTFPSKAVLEFYDIKFKEIGWIKFKQPFRDEYGSYRKWIHFLNDTICYNQVTHQLHAFWVNHDKSRMAFLLIRYFSSCSTPDEKVHIMYEPNNDIQFIFLQIGPFREIKKRYATLQ